MRASTDIPVVLFVYRRPETLARVLASLRDDAVPLLRIYSDAPRNEASAGDVALVRRMISAIDWCECQIVERPSNLGLGASVKQGVGETLRQYDAAIVFEDDLICVPGTYRYLSAALRRYADDDRVMSVTAWTHPRITPSAVAASPYFDGKGECWAWGTWPRAWQGMETAALDIMAACRDAGIDPERYGTDMPKMAAEAATRNLWAIGWWYLHMRKRGLCLRPPWSMVEHICWDEERSTTTTPIMQVWANPPLRPAPPIPAHWPEPAEHQDCVPLWRVAIDGDLAAAP